MLIFLLKSLGARKMFKLKMLYKKIKELLEIYFMKKKITFLKNKRYVFIMLAANYDNLGDIAITQTQEKFLKNCLKDTNIQIIKIPVEDTCKVYLSMKKNIKQDSIITLIGGGNNGDLYEFVEKRRRFILKKFKNNKIISFPQTVYYTNTKQGKKYFKEFKKICNNCSNLTLIARERKSYDFYKKNFIHNNILLTPDIVLYNEINNNIKREGASLVFRKDKEKLINIDVENKIEHILDKMKLNYSYNDTCGINDEIIDATVLDNYLLTIGSKKLVITDRLHGMIFSYITKTPCIVFDNNNGKIKNTFDLWLKKQNYIEFCNVSSIEKLEQIINKIIKVNPKMDDTLKDKYKQLIDIIKE